MEISKCVNLFGGYLVVKRYVSNKSDLARMLAAAGVRRIPAVRLIFEQAFVRGLARLSLESTKGGWFVHDSPSSQVTSNSLGYSIQINLL